MSFGGRPVTAVVIGQEFRIHSAAEVIAKLRMNASNPYESPSTNTESRSWRPIDFVIVGVWLAIPIGVFVGRQPLLHVFTDFGVELPTATQYLLSFFSPILLTIASLVVLLGIFIIPYGGTRRRFIWLACITGMLIGAIYSLSILGSLLSLWRDLN